MLLFVPLEKFISKAEVWLNDDIEPSRSNETATSSQILPGDEGNKQIGN